LKARVLRYIQGSDYVSFAELAGEFPDHFAGGPCDIEIRPNLFLWVGLPNTGAAVITELLNKRQVLLHASSIITYLQDGAALRLPTPKRSQASYRTPHWLPVTLRPAIRPTPDAIRQALKEHAIRRYGNDLA
jgi:hypothetical protein